MNIVLVHGVLGFRNLVELGPIRLVPYFRDVARHFEARDHRVLAVELDKTASVARRAVQLGEQIAAALGTGGPLDWAQKTHIVAHSMGGLDSRYLLSPANPTPSTGSSEGEIVSAAFRQKDWSQELTQSPTPLIERQFVNRTPSRVV